MPVHEILITVFLWSSYFVLHSLMASLAVKNRVARHWPALMPYQRLFYNAVATVLLVPILWFVYSERGPFLWQWQGLFAWIANGLALFATAGFFWTLRYYSATEFLGTRQWREHTADVEDQEHFALSPLHRLVRHPWYFLGLVILWTRDMDPLLLTTAIAVSAYLFIGSRLEERKLLRYHGEVYRRYMKRVPPLIPLPWRHLSKEEGRELMAEADRQRRGRS